MTNLQMETANDVINDRAFNRAFDWATDEIYYPLYETEEFQKAEIVGEILSPAQHALMDAAFAAAEASGELDELLDPDNEIYTRAYNREEAEYMYHILAALGDDGPLEAHFAFLLPFGITPENVRNEDDEAVLTE